MPLAIELLVYAVCCAALLTWSAPDSRLFLRVSLSLLTLTLSCPALEWPVRWVVAAWRTPSTHCVLGVDSGILSLATLAEAPTVLFLSRFRGGPVSGVGLGSVMGILILWSGLALGYPL